MRASRAPATASSAGLGLVLQGGQEFLAIDAQQAAFLAGADGGGARDAMQQPEFADIPGRGHRRAARVAASPSPVRTEVRRWPGSTAQSGRSPSRISTLARWQVNLFGGGGQPLQDAAIGIGQQVELGQQPDSLPQSAGHRRRHTVGAQQGGQSEPARRIGIPAPMATSATMMLVWASTTPMIRLASKIAAQHHGVADTEHPAEHGARHVALQAGQGQHVHDDHADAGDGLQDRRASAGERTGMVTRNGTACRQMLPMMTGARRPVPLSRLARPAPSTPPSALRPAGNRIRSVPVPSRIDSGA